MVETISLDLIPNRIAQYKSKTPIQVLVENGYSVYNNLINNISTKYVNVFGSGLENVLSLDKDNILFANTYENVNIYSKMATNDLMVLVQTISSKFLPFRFEEDISIFHLDKIMTNKNSLLKITEQTSFKIDYVISSNQPVVFSASNNMLRISGSDISINGVNEYYVKSLLKSELDNSLILLKISENSLIDIQAIMKKMSKYSTIINYDKINRVLAVKMNLIVDLKYELADCYQSPRLRSIIMIDRTNWLHNVMRK